MPERKRMDDEPPTTLSPAPRYDAPPREPTTEARLNLETNPPPGPGTEPTGISPTIGGADVDLTPKNTGPEPLVSKTSSTASNSPPSTTNGTTTGTGSKSPGSFLIGKKTSKAGRVVSPYAPYNELDITGLPSGSLALDPTTQKVFEVP